MDWSSRGLHRPIEPGAERLDVARLDRCAAPYAKARRCISISGDIECRTLALEELTDRFLARPVRRFIRTVGELQAHRRVGTGRRINGEMLDPIGLRHPSIQRLRICVRSRY